jgi:hypothetical protein
MTLHLAFCFLWASKLAYADELEWNGERAIAIIAGLQPTSKPGQSLPALRIESYDGSGTRQWSTVLGQGTSDVSTLANGAAAQVGGTIYVAWPDQKSKNIVLQALDSSAGTPAWPGPGIIGNSLGLPWAVDILPLSSGRLLAITAWKSTSTGGSFSCQAEIVQIRGPADVVAEPYGNLFQCEGPVGLAALPDGRILLETGTSVAIFPADAIGTPGSPRPLPIDGNARRVGSRVVLLSHAGKPFLVQLFAFGNLRYIDINGEKTLVPVTTAVYASASVIDEKTFDIAVGSSLFRIQNGIIQASYTLEKFKVSAAEFLPDGSVLYIMPGDPAQVKHVMPEWITTNHDSDGDMVLYGVDACPDAGETPNGNADADGCPDGVVASLPESALKWTKLRDFVFQTTTSLSPFTSGLALQRGVILGSGADDRIYSCQLDSGLCFQVQAPAAPIRIASAVQRPGGSYQIQTASGLVWAWSDPQNLKGSNDLGQWNWSWVGDAALLQGRCMEEGFGFARCGSLIL